MNEGKIARLKEAKETNEKVRLIFKYPEFERRTIKSGFVKEVYEDSFDFEEVFDGRVSYSYEYLVEISAVGGKHG